MAARPAAVQPADDPHAGAERGDCHVGAGTPCPVGPNKHPLIFLPVPPAQERHGRGPVSRDPHRGPVLHHEPAHDEGRVVRVPLPLFLSSPR